MAGVDLGSIVAHLKLEMSDFNNNLNRATDELNNAQNNFRGLQSAGESLSSIGATLTAGVTAPIVALGASVVKTQMDFEASMSKVQALSGATSSELEKMKETAIDLGGSTIYSASECADAMGYMALAGWDAQESIDGLPGILNLAAASGMDLAQASDMCTDYLSAFGLSAADSSRMADVLAYAQANSNTTTEMLGEAFKNCAVNAHNAGMSLEETTSILGKLADQGLKGSEAGTALNAVIRDLTQHMENGQIKIGDTSIAVQDANGNFRSMTDIIGDVTKATEGMGSAQKTSAMMTTFTADSIKAMGILCNTGADDIANFTKELENSKGTAQKMSDMMNKNLKGALNELSGAWETFQLHLADTTGPLSLILGLITELIRTLDKLPDPVKQVLVTIAMLIALVGPVMLAFGKFITGVIKFKNNILKLKALITTLSGTIMSLVDTAITALYVFITDTLIPALSSLWVVLMENPIILVIAVIAALVAAFIYAWNNIDGFKEWWINLWDVITSAVSTGWEHIKGFFTETIPNAFNSFITWLGELPGKIGNWLQQTINSVTNWAMSMAAAALDAGINFCQNVLTFIQQLPYKIAYALGYILGTIISWVANLAIAGYNAGSTFVSNVITFFQQLPGRIWNWLTQTVTKVGSWVSSMASKAKQAGSAFLNSTITYFQQLPGRVWTWLLNTINRISSWVSTTKAKAIQAGSSFLNGVITYIQQLPGRVWTWLTNALSRVASFVSTMRQQAIQAGTQFVSNIVNALTSLPSKLYNIGASAVQGLINGIKSGASALWSAAQNLAAQAWNGMKDALKIGSPSKVMAEKIGQWIPKGVTVGIQDNASDTLKAIKEYASSLVQEIDTNKFLGQVNMSTSGININSDSSLDSQTVSLMTRLIQAVQENKPDFDYDKMGEVYKKANSETNTNIYMDRERVGVAVATSVKNRNDYLENQEDRFRGGMDYV